MKQISTLIISLMFCLSGQTQWTEQYSGVSAYLTGVHFTDTTHGWCSGTGGTILHTKDGGATWDTLNSNTNEDLRAVVFRDRNTGWVVGDNGTILFTDNGGTTWTNQYLPDLANVNFRSIGSYGNRVLAAGIGGQIYYTTNSGVSWVKGAKRDGNIEALFMETDMTAWFAGQNTKVIHKTEDGGSSISLMREDDFHYAQQTISVSGNTVITGGGWSSILISKDRGTTWSNSSIGSGNTNIHSAHLFNEEQGLLLYSNVLFETNDSCKTWDTLFVAASGSYYDMFALDTGHVWFVGSSGRIYASFDASIYVGKEHITATQNNNIHIYPVPAKTGEAITIHITVPQQQEASIFVFNLQGGLALSKPVQLHAGKNTQPITGLAPGVYICQVIVGGESFKKRIVVL